MALTPPNLAPDSRTLRQFGWVALVGFGLIGAAVAWRGGLFGLSFGAARWPVAGALFGLAVLSLLLGLVKPTANRFIYVPLTVATYPIGLVVSFTLLALFFFGLITPLGLLFRLIGRDPLHRRIDPGAASYWFKRTPARMERYFKPF